MHKAYEHQLQDRVFSFPSEHKTYSGELPNGIKGEFGPGIRSIIITLYHVANVSEPKIHEFLVNIGVYISRVTISRVLTKDTDIFHQEKVEIFLMLKPCEYKSRINSHSSIFSIIYNPQTFLKDCELECFKPPKLEDS